MSNIFFTLIIIDIISFVISDFSQAFLKSMNREVVFFKKWYILETLSSVDKGFTHNITYNSNNDVSGVVWMASCIRDNFDRSRNDLHIDVM